MDYVEDVYKQFNSFIETTKISIENLLTMGIVPSIVMAVDSICLCQSKVVTTGLGKAGHAAEKSASSFSSFGIPACYLHPASASHGDVGIIQKGDVLLAFSTSGKTREVIETVQLSRKIGVGKVISITSHSDSPIRNISDIVIDMGIIKEAGYLSLAPTTSIIVMLIVSDIIATICAKKKNVTNEFFGLRHHSGYLGAVARGDGIIK